ncbi:hypothetical protein ACFYWS_32980 [Streptomyces sp. NPDC002795]|uniref:hypothetical protein n=1 Tax=Streptomyces sp. NPDC002795 TaxID=3364665 RepID=UPI0036CB4150
MALDPIEVYDISDFGQPPLHGPAAIKDAALALGAGNPVAHHITNVVLTEVDADRVHALSKGIGIKADGWRIARRKVIARRVPLGGR